MERPMQRKAEPGLLVAGWNRLRQSHKALWWVYAVNLVLSLFSAVGFGLRISRVLDHSTASARLVTGMNLGYLIELATHRDVQPAIAFNSTLAASALFFLFTLFALGGILQSYARERHLVPGEFFQAAGSFFWRFVRLLIWTVVFLISVGIIYALFVALITRAFASSSHPTMEFWLRLIVCAVIWIILAIIRLCFDLAQVRTVIEDRRGMTRVLAECIRLTRRHLRQLFPVYFAISLVGWIGTALAFWCWLKLAPPENTLLMFVLGQFVVLLWITTRLWQRAAEVTWFQRYRQSQLALALPAPIEAPKAFNEQSTSPDESSLAPTALYEASLLQATAPSPEVSSVPKETSPIPDPNQAPSL